LKDDTHTRGMSLEKQLYPNYFQTISSSKIVVINDARNDPRTSEFASTYLEALDIYSMLEIPLVQDSELLGVICHETTGRIHHWDIDEQKFCMSIANNLSLSLEIKKRNEMQEMLDYQAHHDQLTKLPNRTLFLDRLHQAIKQNKRNETKMALLFIDLDNFKQINDSLGHDAGDKVLQEIAQRLGGKIRESDTLARLGGDEFTLILNNIIDDDTIIDIVENILQVTQKLIEIQTQQLYVTLSIGISIYPNDGESAEDLLKYADAAMYKSKESGKNTYHYYTQEMTQKAMRRVQMETELRMAIENEEFVVYFQPQFDARYDTIIGMEALVRWMHPTKGLISPLDFIPIAEEIGVIVDIDKCVMKIAMQQVKAWHQNGLYGGKLALNLSTVMLQCDTFVPNIQAFLKSIDFDTSRLELEITEGHIMKDPEKSIQKLHEIAALGINIAIDDFGTGYSSLSYLKKLPVHKLKIDKSFVDGIPFDEDDCAITKTIIGLSKNLKLEVIAEGVETLDQRDFLLQNSCQNIQGYYYCKPLNAHDMEEKLSEILIK
ncbi:MAG: EAL domain-containing protein, partial [Sulfurimonas sp.]